MTTPVRIQIHDPDHPHRTILRIGFWLASIVLLALLIHSCAGSRDDTLAERVPAPKAKEEPTVRSPVVVVPAPGPPAAASSRKPRPPAAKPPAPTKTPATRQPSRTPTPARPTSRPQPPRITTPHADPEPAVPIPPAPSDASTGGDGGATSTTGTGTTTTQPEPVVPTPPTPKPPSNHNCDGANETC